jgi:transcriptional regulator with XRE-family HTH domain
VGIHSSIGTAIKALRTGHNYVQTFVASELGISVSAYSHYECDDRSPDTASLIKLANLYNINVNYLIFLTCLDVCKRDNLSLEDVFMAFSHETSIPPNEAHILSVYNRLPPPFKENVHIFMDSIDTCI